MPKKYVKKVKKRYAGLTHGNKKKKRQDKDEGGKDEDKGNKDPEQTMQEAAAACEAGPSDKDKGDKDEDKGNKDEDKYQYRDNDEDENDNNDDHGGQEEITATRFYGSSYRYVPRWVRQQQDEEDDCDSFIGFDASDDVPTDRAESVRRIIHEQEPVTLALENRDEEDEEHGGARRRNPSSRLQLRSELLKKSECYRTMSKRHIGRAGAGVGLMNVSEIHSLLEGSQCSNCFGDFQVTMKTYDLDTGFSVKCSTCHEVRESGLQRRTRRNLAEGTAGLVNHSMNTGGGYADLNKLIADVNLGSTLSKRRYRCYQKELNDKTQEMVGNYRPAVRESVFAHYDEQGIEPKDDNILNTDVSFDGTWLTRGHKSKIGASFVMEADTGYVLDFEVLSKYCQMCVSIKSKYRHDEDRCTEEVERHKDSGECSANYTGTSGGMEKQMALNMWLRSEEKNKMRYTTIISDGDSSTYTALLEEEPYGLDHPITKEECVNHVAKRMGTRLRKLKKDYSEEVITDTGRRMRRSYLAGRGKMTDELINKLSKYYGKAIRDNVNKDVESMRKACLSGFKHVTSNDENPDHEYCPTGKDSYCFYNKAIANNEETPSHDTMRVRMQLDEEHKQVVYRLYGDLTQEDLLNRCLKGRTQNPNESMHSKLWNKLKKSKFYGLKTVQQAAAAVAMEHNFGYSESNVLEAFEFGASTQGSRNVRTRRDKYRLSSASKRKREGPHERENNEDCDYGPGEF